LDAILLFPFAEYWDFYVGFTLFVLAMLALDLGVFHRDTRDVTFKEAATWGAVWIALALLFAWGLHEYALWKFPQDARLLAVPGFEASSAAKQVTLEYLTGFIIEKSLAVDNVFIFVVVFSFFSIPAKYQHRVLFYGILGALFFRVIFIALGAALMKYHLVVIMFGIFLIATGVKIFFSPEKGVDPDRNPLIKLLKRFLPVTPQLHDKRFLVTIGGVRHATPLLVCLVFIEISDIIFAVDSVPAIFAVTKEPFIVYTSNVFAILGLRSLYFLLGDLVTRFRLLKYGLGLILVFVGLKMVWLNNAFDGKFPIAWSLGIIGTILAMSVAASLIVTKNEPRKP